jgi:hypothetical protein
MTVRHAVTFEFDSRPPLTHKHCSRDLVGPHVWRGRNTQHKALRPVNWSSMVVGLLERVPDDTDHPSGKPAGVRGDLGDRLSSRH